MVLAGHLLRDLLRKMPKKSYYAVQVGRNGPGIYRSWAECSEQVTGHGGAIFKGFSSLTEAEAYLASSGPQKPHKRPMLHQAAGAEQARPVVSRNDGVRGAVMAEELALFTDGACAGNTNVATTQNPAGWGVVVVDGCRGNPPVGGTSIAELYGPVELDSSRVDYLGAGVCSNNTGELSAVCHALMWLTRRGTSGPAVICYDSEYAANQARGLHKAHKNVELSRRSKELLAKAQTQAPVRFLHVKGHSNNQWNDMADQLANLGATGARSGGEDNMITDPDQCDSDDSERHRSHKNHKKRSRSPSQ